MAILVVALFFTISKIVVVEMCLNLTVIFRMGQGQMYNKPIEISGMTQFDENSNVLTISNHVKHVCSQNAHDVDVVL